RKRDFVALGRRLFGGRQGRVDLLQLGRRLGRQAGPQRTAQLGHGGFDLAVATFVEQQAGLRREQLRPYLVGRLPGRGGEGGGGRAEESRQRDQDRAGGSCRGAAGLLGRRDRLLVNLAGQG